MLLRFFKQWKWKRLARQLRQPSGKAGKETGLLMNHSNRFMYALTLEQLALKKGDRVLEIGFGNGHFFRQLLTTAEDIQLYGIDYSSLMVAEAEKEHQDLIQNGQLKLAKGNSDSMPWPDQFFDRIFCINVIYFWENPADHLKEISRVLKTGGQFFATCRSKENMSLLPFTKWNFKPYTAAEWETILIKNGLSPHLKKEVSEPGLQEAGVPFETMQWSVGATKTD